MSVLLLELAGPMQSWGESSRYATRDTGRQPTKSGILGLLAAAEGRRRTDPIEDLVDLRFGVRTDQPGRVLSDFQTARDLVSGKAQPLTTRYYLSDAVFVAGLEGERNFLEQLLRAIRSPACAPYLGRRSFAPTRNIGIGLVDQPLQLALAEYPWQASQWFRRRLGGRPYWADVSVDASGWTTDPGEHSPNPDLVEDVRIRDVPLSWDLERRDYGWRKVRRYRTLLSAGDVEPPSVSHRPMEEL